MSGTDRATGCSGLAALTARTSELRDAAQACGQRRWLLLRGAAATDRRATAAIIAAWGASAPRVLWLGDATGPHLATGLLGGEYDLIVVDGRDGFDLDALGAAVGTLRAGGLLVLRLADDPAPEGRCDARLARLLASAPVPPAAPVPGAAPAPPPAPADPAAATADQARALAALRALARGRARRPLVLLADRGRGKSAALGLAAARLLAEGWPRVLVSAPRRAAADALFAHAGNIADYSGRLCFTPPDALADGIRPGDLVLIDEAAGIPAPLLEAALVKALATGARIAFATTVHGYEGTGRGFEMRFAAVLTRLAPGWRALRLSEPIRWAVDDPLEVLVNRLLLLDAAPAPDATVGANDPARAEFRMLDRDRLAADEPLLRQVFGLLVLAHYQTRPADLRHLLDGPNLEVAVLMTGGLVLATALVASEGGLPEALLGPIFDGQRRPHGHLLPLTLSAHAGLMDAPRLCHARIVRLAVHPALQRRGLGRRLVDGLAGWAGAAGQDLLGASFGATPELLAFWRAAGLMPVHLGTHRNAASGAHGACVLRPLTARGAGLCVQARRRLAPRLLAQLSGPLRELAPAVVLPLLAAAAPGSELDADDRRELISFVRGHRGLEAALGALDRLLVARLPGLDDPPADASALIRCVAQRWTPAVAAGGLGLGGQAAVIARLRDAVGRLLGDAP